MTETINIRTFNKGTITSPDVEDIPIEASSDGLNVEPDITDGRLRGIPTNGSAYTANGSQIPNVRLAEFIEDDGSYNLIFHNSSANKIQSVTGFYGAEASRVLADQVTSNVSDNSVIVPNNREVHIGTGYASTNVPKWVGLIDHPHFSDSLVRDVFDGSGLDDLTGSFTSYTGNDPVTFEIEIVSEGTPDTFKWRKDGGSYTTGVSITGSAQTLSDGVTITFAATTGHTATEKWYVSKYVANGLRVENAECEKSAVTIPGLINQIIAYSATPHTGSTMEFEVDSVYQWSASLVYDGYQESPLHTVGATWTGAGTVDYVTIVLRAYEAAQQAYDFNLRISAVKLYRKKDDEAWRLVTTVTLDDASWTADGDDLVYSYQDTNASGNLYEEETGLPETLDDTIVNYSLGCKGNGYLFVGRCYHADIEEASQCIFRSMAKRFDMFNWSEDIIRLPRVPTAMAFFLGRLFAFDTNNLYIINPDTLVIEEIYPGAGAVGQRSVTVTPFGMFFANETNAFMFDGKEIIPIGNKIKTSSTSSRSWQSFSFGVLTDIIVLYDTIKQVILFINDNTSKTFAWAYHIQKDRWDAMDFGAITIDANSGAFTGKDGETYLSNATQTVRLFGGASRQNFEWVSQEFTADDPSQDKMWYNVIVDSSGAGTLTTTYGVEGATPTTALTGTQIGATQTYAKTLKIKLVSSGVVDVDSVSILARRLRGARVY